MSPNCHCATNARKIPVFGARFRRNLAIDKAVTQRLDAMIE
jgi:hypothetical protein